MSSPDKKIPVILAADDDENSHLLLKHALQKRNIAARFLTVFDGVGAISYIAGEGCYADREKYPLPHTLLLDWKMPRIGGEGVLEYLGSNPGLHTFPVIVFTSSNADQDIDKAYELECKAYLVKPSSFDKLLELVSALEREVLDPMITDGIPGETCLHQFSARRRSTVKHERPAEMKTQQNPAPPQDIYQLLVEQVKDYAIFMLDVEGIIRSWNDGARRIKGYEPHEIIGKHFSIFYPQNDRDVEKPKYELRMAVEIGRYEEEGWRLRKDGSRFWANVVVTPLYDSSARLTGFAKVTRDLSQRKIQEDNIQRLLESEERFRLLVDQVKDYAIFMLDPRGTITSWNQGGRRLKGYTADEVIGKHFSIFYTAIDIQKDHPSKELSIAIRDGGYEEEGWRVRKDGTRFWASVVITSLWDRRGNLTGYAKVTRDLTQRKIQEDILRRKTEDLESFAHTLSHDLRAPLRSISSFAQILTDEGNLSEREANYLAKITHSAHSMDTLINDILKLSHVTVSTVEEKKFPLEEVLCEALSMHESEIVRTGAVINIQNPLPAVTGSFTLLVQIFSNLIHNALKFVSPGKTPEIEIYSLEHEGLTEIHVKDKGVGVPARFQEQIFKVFDRGTAATSVSGTGVGLAIVKKAAERLGGSINVISEGEGSDFTVTLPYSHPDTNHLPAPPSA